MYMIRIDLCFFINNVLKQRLKNNEQEHFDPNVYMDWSFSAFL
jgi:hypothetical protein